MLRLAVVLSLLFLSSLAILLGRAITLEPRPEINFTSPQRMLILAAHQDDCVIQAGGAAIKNARLGGDTFVAYLTHDHDIYNPLRKEEATAAWSLLGTPPELIFLDFPSEHDWTDEKYHAARTAVMETIERVQPDIIFAPLHEGGHEEHDILSKIASDIARTRPSVQLLLSAEYNPYYIAGDAPQRVFTFLLRLLPFVAYSDSPSGLILKNQLQLQMSEEELALKNSMLSQFDSQAEVVPLKDFGYPDLYERTSEAPSYFVDLFGKKLSLGAFIVIANAFACAFAWGAVFGLTCHLGVSLCLQILILSYLGSTMERDLHLFLEDYTFVATVLSGAAFTTMLRVFSWARHSTLELTSYTPSADSLRGFSEVSSPPLTVADGY